MTEQKLATRLATIMGEVGRVEKKGKITSMGSGPTYKFARDSDVMEAVTPKMAEAGIVMIPEHVELLSMGLSLSEKQFIGNIKTSWHVTDGNESLRFETFGQGADSGDKALPKAQSNARKYAFFMLYHIVTGDDPDQHGSYEQPERARGGSPSSPSASAPVQPHGELRDRVAQAALDHGISHSGLSLMADAVGVPKGERANEEQLLAILARIETPGSGVPTVDPVSGGGSSAPAATTPSSGEPVPDAATVPDSEAGDVPPGTPSESASAPNDLMDDILAVTGGEEVPVGSNITLRMSPPAKVGTAEYKGYTAQQKVEARAYWQLNPEPEEVPA